MLKEEGLIIGLIGLGWRLLVTSRRKEIHHGGSTSILSDFTAFLGYYSSSDISRGSISSSTGIGIIILPWNIKFTKSS